MPQNRLPIWLSGRDRAVADALIADGFKYLGCPYDPEDMLAPEQVGDWYLSSVQQEPMLEACHTIGALFFKDYSESASSLTEQEFERIKRLISQAQFAWDTASNAGQLSLPGVASA
ncbi:hypothetical protein [Argonema antarcticum]|uniref:hypothetical protein n=1 Tax=Argonema antarcticum TaxID=2942763 RepID=UPI002012D78D|nr:hypothetical protein [Argonema antarcticum]MCL1475700.1 hypothetical protein [Argonema antarcticum A004/B2]